MLKSILCTCLLFIISLSFAQTQSETQGPFGTFITVEFGNVNQNIDGYNLYVPHSSKQSDTPYPVLIFLQGGLGVGGDVDKIYNWGLPKLIKQGTALDSQVNKYLLDTFIVLMPHIATGNFYSKPESITQILDQIYSDYNADSKRVYCTGLSRGGHGTWGLADDLKDTFAAVAPICGRTGGVENFQDLVNLPMWVSHNTGDGVVGFRHSQDAVQRIEQLAGYSFYNSTAIASSEFEQHDYIFTATVSDSHDAWTEFYTSPEVYAWFLKYTKE